MSLLQYIVEKKHHVYRQPLNWDLAAEYSAKGLAPAERMADRFERLCAAQTPVLLPEEQIVFMRTVSNIPAIFTDEEWAEISGKYRIHELGFLSNLCPDYESCIREGLLAKKQKADAYSARAIDALIALADRYKAEAEKQGKTEIAETLTQVPRYGARNFREALQFFRILHFGMWLEGNYHNTVGRFDKYMYPYFKADMDKGVYTYDTALALIEDFFLSFNKDSDLYPGVQMGDNGQSLVLGGRDAEGKEVFSLLSELCLKASGNLKLIDPKINLRVNKETPLRLYELGSELTKAGLGFPQYSNDDVVIPGLVNLGYAPEDAADYAVAACWEFIIPKKGADVANIAAMSYPKAVDAALHKALASAETYDQFMAAVANEIQAACNEICADERKLWFIPSPFANVTCGCEIDKGAKYNNFGVHGTGIATAADSLAAIKKYVFDEKRVSAAELIDAVDTDFANAPALLALLRNEAPKLGQDNDEADQIAVALLDTFANALEGKTNCRGGRYRAGTGSALFYLWHAGELGASPDGRRKGEAFGTNFSVSLFAKIPGPMSVVQSFTKFNFDRAINGGPLTLEFHNKMFENPECITKLARFIQSYILMGGHQLQLNAVSPEKMKQAQLHPEQYGQLVVRIWGWSAYFVELDKEFQDHVMARQEYTV